MSTNPDVPRTDPHCSISVSSATLARQLMMALVPLWIIGGAFVLFEPSPYELFFPVLLALALLSGLQINKKNNALLAVILAFIPPAYIAIFQMKYEPISTGLVFTTVTVFLLFTTYFVANFVAEKPYERLRLILRAYIFAAVLSASAGLLAFFALIPDNELLLRYGRVKALFKDPNVFGPFLVLPAAYLLQRLLLGDRQKLFFNAVLFGIICTGIFMSFSRGAWGHLTLTILMVFALSFITEPRVGGRRVWIVIAALGGLALCVLAFTVLLMIPDVAEMFSLRAAILHNYDSGETGRFGRQAWGYALALDNPLGIGPLQFAYMLVTEQPHNTYLKVFLDYGWLGGGLFIWLILLTLWRGFASLAVPGPGRTLMIPALSTFVPLTLEAAIIDVDHWRHFFLIAGIIWGVAAGYSIINNAGNTKHFVP